MVANLGEGGVVVFCLIKKQFLLGERNEGFFGGNPHWFSSFLPRSSR